MLSHISVLLCCSKTVAHTASCAVQSMATTILEKKNWKTEKLMQNVKLDKRQLYGIQKNHLIFSISPSPNMD